MCRTLYFTYQNIQHTHLVHSCHTIQQIRVGTLSLIDGLLGSNVWNNLFYLLEHMIYDIITNSEYMQVGSCFEDLVVRHALIQTGHQLGAWFKRYVLSNFWVAKKKAHH